MEELLRERLEMYRKEIEKVSDEINEETREWKMRQLIRKHTEYVAIRDELNYLLYVAKRG